MDSAKPIVLPPEREFPAYYRQDGVFHYRAAYARSADSRSNNESGQDYLIYRIENQRFAFALCDGVSQSYYGDLAASILGNSLINWVWNLDLKQPGSLIQDTLRQKLDALVNDAESKVREHYRGLPGDISSMLRTALDKKFVIGSESTFVAGLIDIPGNISAFVWMGDSRLRLWQNGDELTAPFDGQFKTSERWSTVKGLVGELHFLTVPLTHFNHLVVYSDGFPYLDTAYPSSKANQPFSNHAIDAFMADAALRPSSDDISFLEIWTTPTAPQFPAGAEKITVSGLNYDYRNETHHLVWKPTHGATNYEIRLSTENKTTLASSKIVGNEWQTDEDLDPKACFISVRAWIDQEPGNWSGYIPLQNTSYPTTGKIIDVSPGPRTQTVPLTPPAPKVPDNGQTFNQPQTAIPVPPPDSQASPQPQPQNTAFPASASDDASKNFRTDLPETNPAGNLKTKPRPSNSQRKGLPIGAWAFLGSLVLILCIGAVIIGTQPPVQNWLLGIDSSETPVATFDHTPKKTRFPNATIRPSSTHQTPEAISTTEVETPPTITAILATGTETTAPTVTPTGTSTDSPAPSPSNTNNPGQITAAVLESQYNELLVLPTRRGQLHVVDILRPGELVSVISKYQYRTTDPYWYLIHTERNTEGWVLADALNLEGVDITQIPYLDPFH